MADPTSPSPYSENKRFEPKVPVELQAPKNDLISLEELAQYDGMPFNIPCSSHEHPHPLRHEHRIS